jgi:hypothetical protein
VTVSLAFVLNDSSMLNFFLDSDIVVLGSIVMTYGLAKLLASNSKQIRAATADEIEEYFRNKKSN